MEPQLPQVPTGVHFEQRIIAPLIRSYEYGDISEDLFLDSLTGMMTRSGFPDAFVVAYMRDSSFKPVCKAYLERMPVIPNPEDGAYCVICSTSMASMELVAILPCSHSYHEACIRGWFSSNNTCPSCRLTLFTSDVKDFQSIGDSTAAMRAEITELEERDAALTEAVAAVQSMVKPKPTTAQPPQCTVDFPHFFSQSLTGSRSAVRVPTAPTIPGRLNYP